MDGILLINKPKDFSSHDVVAVLRGILKTRKIGHTGTLDPDATGLLVVGVGLGTKIMRFLNQDSKTYEAVICIGKATDTLDEAGEVIEEKSVEHIDNFDDVLNSFKGDIVQIPPMYSAIKYQGKRLYEYARKGIDIPDRPKRDIHIYDIDRTSELTYENNCAYVSYKVKGSKGFYVRTLSHDIARKCGYPGYNKTLNRLQAGQFNVTDALTLEEMREGNYSFISLSDALSHMPLLEADAFILNEIKYGRMLPLKYFENTEDTRIINKDNELLAIYTKHPTKPMMKALNVFYKD